jgi:hypothetical protein
MFERTMSAVGMNVGMNKLYSIPTQASFLTVVNEDTPRDPKTTATTTTPSDSSSASHSSSSGSISSNSHSTADSTTTSSPGGFGFIPTKQLSPSASPVGNKETTPNSNNMGGLGSGLGGGLGGMNLLGNKETEAQALRKEMALLKLRLDKVEKTSVALSSGKTKTSISNFVDSLAANTMEMNAKTVEVCSTVAFFAVGTVVGASLLDRLWLLGGLLMGWWASGAVHRDTRGGMVSGSLRLDV